MINVKTLIAHMDMSAATKRKTRYLAISVLAKWDKNFHEGIIDFLEDLSMTDK